MCTKRYPVLAHNFVDGLPDPPAGEEVDREILEKLCLLRQESFPLRRVEPLEKLIEERTSFNATEIVGILTGSRECPLVSRRHSVKILVALAGYFARTSKSDHVNIDNFPATLHHLKEIKVY